MLRNFTYLCVLAVFLGLGGCKALEPIDQNFFLGRFVDQGQAAPVARETYPVLIFRTPGYEMWSKEDVRLEVDGEIHLLGRAGGGDRNPCGCAPLCGQTDRGPV